jgi:anaerobic selenocysteine-containing dehydrogenase
MSDWQKTGCICCAQNCGLEVLVEDNRIVKVRPDKDNPRSEGYCCRKGLQISHYQSHADRLTKPLKKVGDRFVEISWETFLDEVAAKLKAIRAEHGPRSLAYMGGGGQGCHFEAAFGVRLLRALGSQYHYSALAQELTGMFWVHGRAFGRQYLVALPDEERSDMLIALGWNGMQSHQMPQARRRLGRFAEDPSKLLVCIDPRKSETAAKADLHIPLRPGTDALLLKALIAILIQKGWIAADYIEGHVSGYQEIRPLFEGFDAAAAAKVCDLEYETVEELARLMATRRWCMHTDLGILMNRHSTVTSYSAIVALALCGRLCVPGGNVIAGHLMPMGSHSDERLAKTWKTVATGFPAIMGVFPPNVMPEEIMSHGPDRLRAVLVSGANPLRSYADTTAYEEAFGRLDLLVTIDVAMTETARLSHYVAPALSAYEKWDATFFSWNWPEIYFQMRRPVVKPVGDCREESEIMVGLAERLGVLPDIPAPLREAARGDRLSYGMQLMQFFQSQPEAMRMAPFVLAKTLGEAMGSANKAALWGLLQTAPAQFREQAARMGFEPGPLMGEALFKAILDRPEGLWIGKCDGEDNFGELKTEDKKINVWAPELAEMVRNLDAASEETALIPDPRFPLILSAGRHFDYNANTIMRDPSWNDPKKPCTMLMSPSDAESAGIVQGDVVRVVTEAGAETISVEITEATRPGCVVIPHGFGLNHAGETYGANVNRLTKNTHRDPVAATPLHRYVPCRVEKV